MARKKVVSKTSKKQSIKEFKAWLSGISEFQPNDWCPNAEQWSLIKEKIANLQDEVYVAPREREEPAHSNQPQNVNQQAPRRSNVPSLMQPRDQVGLEVQQVDINQIMPLRQPPEAALPIPSIPVEGASNYNVENLSGTVKFSGKQIKTPNIDTSAGGYRSPFSA